MVIATSFVIGIFIVPISSAITTKIRIGSLEGLFILFLKLTTSLNLKSFSFKLPLI